MKKTIARSGDILGMKSPITFLIFFLFALSGQLFSQAPPACNIEGPLKACLGQGDILITSQIVYGTETPNIKYVFNENSSGASIVSKGEYQFDAVSGIGYQTVTINPGNQSGTFNIRLLVIAPDGSSSSCSKSLTVIGCQSQMGKQ